MRHIVWPNGRFGAAIMIHLHTDNTGVNTTGWDFSTIAWLADTPLLTKPTYVNDLVKKVEFRIVEKNIDQLLIISEKNLKAIRVENLK